MPLFTVLSFRTPKSAENLKIISTNSWKSAQCMFYIRFLYYIRPLKETTTHLSMFPNKDTPCGWENEVVQKRSRDMPDVVNKKDCFLLCFVQNIRYHVGTSDVTIISNDQGNILQISCKTSLEKNWVLLWSANAWIGTHATFLVILKRCGHFSVVQSFQFKFSTHLTYYRANICDQLIKNTTIMSVDVILSI